MAKKKYNLTIALQQAQSNPPFFTIVYGGAKTRFLQEDVTMTLDEAIAYRDQLSKAEPRTHEASIRMTNSNDRAAPGLNKLGRIQKVGVDAFEPTKAA
ncbi:MAG: hypothetical protein CMK74_03855 [Pseudomonadales bacterium]|nr:hypothetical protein [Pseudomonadales bacterium]|tara:strand:- start:8 stop:301 length:294 start_codon:yes stop_codon:yes gene_type:complete